MDRRSKTTNGFVNFPVNDPQWSNSGEGGMYITLVVEDSRDWMICCGGNVHILRDEILLKEEEHHFCYKAMSEYDRTYEQLSIRYLAAIILGSTGWSGWNEGDGYWRCKKEDLTEEGKQLYNSMGKLYPNCKIHLLTWLDT